MFQLLKSAFGKGFLFLTKRPTISFFALILVLFGIIVFGQFLRAPKDTDQAVGAEKKTAVLFTPAADTALLNVPAKVKKESVIDIVALVPGIVTTVSVTPGQKVFSGQTLITLTNDYQSGGSALTKRIATQNAALSERLAHIDRTILRLEEKKTKHDDTLTSTEEDIALAKLKKERITRENTLEQSALTVALSNVSDAVLKPKALTSGVVGNIRVKRGDLVNPGDILLTINSAGVTTLEAMVDQTTAAVFDSSTESALRIGDETIKLRPTFFSTAENSDGLFSILFSLSPLQAKMVTDGSYITIAVPLKSKLSGTTLVPIDALFQDGNGAWVLVAENGRAVSRTVTLGFISGSFVAVTSGIIPSDHIILSRAIIAGDDLTW